MPIGSGAVYVPAGLQQTFAYGGISNDEEYIDLDPADPLRALNGGALVHVRPTLSHDGSLNGTTALLAADDFHVMQGQPLSLAAGGNPSWRYAYPTVDIRGDCIDGAHGGSGLSSFAGSIRAGELSGPDPIRHALKLEVWAKRFLSCTSGGFRWPARRADQYMNCTTYGGVVPQMRMGSLLALAPNFDCTQFTSAQVRVKLCPALRDFGGIVVDDTNQDVTSIAMDSREDGPFDDGGSWRNDLMTVFTSLNVIDSNGPMSIGGGGAPRVSLAPPFAGP